MQKDKKKRGFFSLISPFLVFYAVTMVIQVAIIMSFMIGDMDQIIASVTEFESEIAYSNQIFEMLMEKYIQNIALISGLSALCAIPVFYLMMNKDTKYEKLIGYPTFEKASWKKYLPLIPFAIAICIGCNNLLLLSNIGELSEAYQSTSEVMYNESFINQLIAFGIIIPIQEEMMFRGLIFKRMSYMSGMQMAAILSGIVFGVYHGNLVQGLYGMVMGYFLAWIYMKFGSLKAPILVHIVANFTSILATRYDIFTWIFSDIFRVMIVTGLCALIGSTAFVVMRNSFRKEKQDENSKETTTEESVETIEETKQEDTKEE